MKCSIPFYILALVAPVFASPKYSKSVDWSKYKKEHHHHRTETSSTYPTLSPSGGFEGEPTGTGGLGPAYPTPSASQTLSLGRGGGGGGGGRGGGGEGSPTDTGTVPSSTSSSNSSTVQTGGGVQVPAGCFTKGNVAIGWLPGVGETIGQIDSTLGTTACFDGQYAQITQNGAYSDSSLQLTPSINQLTGGKTIFVASVMPSIPMNQVDSTVAGGVANVMKKFTDQGIEVWLRFAHEMNWYVTDGTYHGSAADFQQAWGAISSAVESNDMVKMFWSPNQASSGDLQQWFPTQGKVDLVGIDIYPKGQQSFGDTYGDFCKSFSTAKKLPFVIGETGAGPDLKEYWLGQVAAGDASACPEYVGFAWFDYNKEEDFRVVQTGIAKQVLG